MNRYKTLLYTLALILTVSSVGCSHKSTSKPNSKSGFAATSEKPAAEVVETNKQEITASSKSPDDSSRITNSSPVNSNTASTNTAIGANSPAPSAPPPISPITPPAFDKTIYIGTTEAEVREMSKGYGSFTDYGVVHEYLYKTSQIYFANVGGTFKVVGWRNINKTFIFSVGNINPSSPAITLGSTREQVASCAGTPDSYDIPYVQDAYSLKFVAQPDRPIQWMYPDGSLVTFDSNLKVIGWLNNGRLRVDYGKRIDSAPAIKLGSTIQDVLNALGTPKSLTPWSTSESQKYIFYDDCTFNIDKSGNVDGWTNSGSLKICMGEKDPSSQPFSIRSSKENVIKAMGTPDKVVKNFTWYYGSSIVYFNADWTVRSHTNTGNLKVM